MEQFINPTDNNARATHVGRASNDCAKKGNASATTDCSKRSTMETLAAAEHLDGKDPIAQEKGKWPGLACIGWLSLGELV